MGEPQRRFAMSNAPLMPKATAVWLVDNTALTFDQVADFTKMHPLEVRAIADGDAAQGIKGMDPISTGQLTRDEIEKGEKDPNYRLRLGESKVTLTPMDPVTLGLCSQIELDFEVQRAAKEKPTETAYGGATLLPASETTRKEPEYEPSEKQREDLNVDAVFAKLKTIGGKKPDQE